MFGRLKSWLKKQLRRKRRWPPPDELTEIVIGLPKTWKLISYKYQGPGWIGELRFKNRCFRVSSDRFSLEAWETIDGKNREILPPGNQRREVTSTLIRQPLLNASAKKTQIPPT